MDLTLPPQAVRAASVARALVESLPHGTDSFAARPSASVSAPSSSDLADLAQLVAASPLARFAAFRQLGRSAIPWARLFHAAGLPFHDTSGPGAPPDKAGLISLALGDPRRLPDPATLNVRATPVTDADGSGWRLHGIALAPGYLTPVDSLIVAATIRTGPEEKASPEVGAFLVKREAPFGPSRPEPGLLRVVLDGTSATRLETGEAAWGWLVALRKRERLSQIALAVGASDRAHELTLAAAREATAAEDPLALGQGVQFQVADNAIDLEVVSALATECAVLAEAGRLTDAHLALTRFMVLEGFERISRRAAHVVGLFAEARPAWTDFFLDLSRALTLEGGAVELDRRQAAAGVLAG